MDLQEINIFIDVVKSKNFGITGKHFNLSPTTIARRIEKLEEDIGQQLLINTTRVFELTATGELVYNKFNKLIDSMSAEIESFSNSLTHQQPHGKLKIQLPMMLPINSITPIIPDFKDLYPEVDLEIIYSNQKPDLENDNIDLAIVNFPFEEYRANMQHVTTRQIKLGCSVEYQKKYGIPQTVKELKDHRLVIYIDANHHNNSHQYTLKLINNQTNKESFVDIVPFIKTNNEFHNRKMMLEGKTICNILDISLEQLDDVITVLPDYSVGEVKYYAITKRNSKKRKIITLLLEFILDSSN